MNHMPYPHASLKALPDQLIDSFFAYQRLHHIGSGFMPTRQEIYRITDELFTLLFPGFYGRQDLSRENVTEHIRRKTNNLYERLYLQIFHCFNCRRSQSNQAEKKASQTAEKFMLSLLRIRESLADDILSAYQGDPAASGTDEIIFSYPATLAIGTYRLANALWKLGVPLMPRIMTEYAHSRTGIDIHPGATIGRGFFIDHGTGVVIGETTIIGDNCKLYQGVTLGAISFPHDDSGLIVRKTKRHPTLEDDVTVYSNASILGNIIIGKGSTVGGGVFLTRAIPPGCTVTTKSIELKYRKQCDVFAPSVVSDFQI
jgi:serine O-acetyltransferase